MRQTIMGLAFLCMLLASLSALSVQARSLFIQHASGTENKILVAVVTAYYKEFNTILPLIDNNVRNETYAGRLLIFGDIAGIPVVLTAAGEGVVNSALTTQALIDRFEPSHLLFAGVSTGIGGAAQRNDVVIPTKWANAERARLAEVLLSSSKEPSSDFYVLSYDVDRPNEFVRVPENANGTVASMTVPQEGCLPPPDETAVEAITGPGGKVVPQFGIPMYAPVLSNPDGQDAFRSSTPETLWFEVDPFLLSVAEMVVAENVTFNSTCHNSHTNKTTQLPYTPSIKIIPEGGLSGDWYLANTQYASDLQSIFGGEVFDMESAAFQYTCASNQAACLVIRSLPNDITDLASADCSSTAFPNLQTTIALYLSFLGLSL